MKKVIIVSKTHLDLGFTDYAENIRKKYITEFFPAACKAAKKLNSGKKHFVWTTGSWILNEALNDTDENRKKELKEAVRRGDIAPHALPFTVHSELLDEDTFNYGLEIVNGIDKISNRKTIAAKMTDVPGHTKGIVPLLYKKGIKLLHIGVNGASAVPEVPRCFLWKNGEAEIVVIYSGAYGGAYECPFTGDVLYFDHTLDNGGADDTSKIIETFNAVKRQYPDYEVVAGRIDDFADELWEKRGELPVVTSEIGDSWIHGSAADPYKSAALRTLIQRKNEWLSNGTLKRNSDEYKALADNILCLSEHTCGLDVKRWFSDYENYLKPDFKRARKANIVKLRYPLRDYPQNMLTVKLRKSGEYNEGSYSAMEKSWAEQRLYINRAVKALSTEHREEIEGDLHKLRPASFPEFIGDALKIKKAYTFGNTEITFNECGGIGSLRFGGKAVIASNNRSPLSYHSYTSGDYDYWLTHYTRDIEKNYVWAPGDFARPLLKYADGKYPSGIFGCVMTKGTVSGNKIQVGLRFPAECHTKLGAPRELSLIYTVEDGSVRIELFWLNKDASRLTESISLNLPISTDKNHLLYNKLGTLCNPYDTVKNGNRRLSAVQALVFGDENYTLRSFNAPLVALGETDILHFDNIQPDVKTDGVSFVLYDNVWGTNFPLWYEENAYFKFVLSAENDLCDS